MNYRLNTAILLLSAFHGPLYLIALMVSRSIALTVSGHNNTENST